ncbi:hypothetical protein R1T43_12215 [Alteromonas sp. CI.11.F.A3]|uniref:hypothetical protein n=1 Tax=Alteromonas sp. CI.11.F.A3 TaxID=3079555 RepID=UPI0029426A23|nr:hypothetical protein [Alteromonas sp. CI.11.F.A3]WOI35987.1 hypothetical protein R1T43_12215 [Alteromonas sp. CI.11.F.A3]
MSTWNKIGTWSMLVIAIVVFMAAAFVLGSTIGTMYVLGSFELSFLEVGIICGGITSISVFVRCVKQLKSNAELAST